MTALSPEAWLAAEDVITGYAEARNTARAERRALRRERWFNFGLALVWLMLIGVTAGYLWMLGVIRG